MWDVLRCGGDARREERKEGLVDFSLSVSSGVFRLLLDEVSEIFGVRTGDELLKDGCVCSACVEDVNLATKDFERIM